MKFLRLTVAIFLSITLPFTPLADAKECEKSDAHPFLLCGNWSEPEIDELLSSLLGDEEIHKIIKKNADFYLLHTCKGRTKENVCKGGLVYFFERTDGMLVVGPETWEWTP